MAHFIKRATLVGAFTAVVVGLAFIAGTPGDADAAAPPIAALTPTPTPQQQVPTQAAQATACVIGGKTFEGTQATPGDCRALDALRVAIPSLGWNVSNVTDPCKLSGVVCNSVKSGEKGVRTISVSRRSGGTLPPEIGDFTNIYTLTISNNRLTGNIPDEIGKLTSLRTLEITNEQFSGPLPASIGSLTNLTNLTLSQTGISGTIPSAFRSLAKLQTLNLSNNALSGQIPDIFAAMPDLKAVFLSQNDLTGTIPTSLSGSPSLRNLILPENKLDGELSDTAFAPASGTSSLQNINLRGNELRGQLPSSVFGPELRSLNAANNNFAGELTVPDAGVPNLKNLGLSGNELSGAIPSAIFTSANLQDVDFSNNKFTGSLPESIGQATNLRELKVSSNELSGSLPTTISSLVNLAILQIDNNEISGPLPANIGKVGTISLLPNGCLTTEDPAVRSSLAGRGYIEPYGPCEVNGAEWGVAGKRCLLPTDLYGEVSFQAANPSDKEIRTRVTIITDSLLQYSEILVVPPGEASRVTFRSVRESSFTIEARLGSKIVYTGTNELKCEDSFVQEGDEPQVIPSVACLAGTSRVDVELNNPTPGPLDFTVKIGPEAIRQATVPAGGKPVVSVYGLPDGPVSVIPTVPGFAVPDASTDVTCTRSLTEPIEAAASCMTGPAGISRGRVDIAIRNTSDLRSVFASALDLQLEDGQVTRSSLRYQTMSSNQLWTLVIPNLSNGTYKLSVLQNGVALDTAFTLEVACEGLPPAPDGGIRVITSCLAGNARADVFIENTTTAPALYTANYGSAGVEKSVVVPASSKKRMVLFNTGDGLGPINVYRDGIEALSEPITTSPCS